jgi:hypothetical protein
MIAWPSGVPKNIYNATTQFSDNIVTIELKSGKKKRYLKNSKGQKIYSVKIDLKNNNTNTCEYAIFINWYELYLKYGSETVSFNKINGTGTAEYAITIDSIEGQTPKIISMTWEEQ